MIALNLILLSVKVGVYTEDGNPLAKANDQPIVFSNNTLQTFSHTLSYILMVSSFLTATTATYMRLSLKLN